MIRSRLVYLFASVAALLSTTGCHKKAPSIWDEPVVEKEQEPNPLWNESEEYSESDLTNQFSEEMLDSQSNLSFGEGRVPTIDNFVDPAGSLVNIFHPIFFGTDRYSLSVEDVKNIKKMGSYLKSHANAYVVVEGHCDSRGARAYNLALGTKRADAVRALLVKQGVDGNRVLTISYGSEKPFAKGNNESAWKQNRRAHFKIVTQ